MSTPIKFGSIDKVKNWLKNLSLSMNNAVRDTGRALTIDAENIAKERVRSPNHKPGKSAGAYFHSIHSEFKDGSFSFIGSLQSDSPIAGVIEFGSRPHFIRSKDTNLLFWPGAKHPVKEVNHPGTPPFRVLGDAVEDAGQQTKDKLEQSLKNQFRS